MQHSSVIEMEIREVARHDDGDEKVFQYWHFLMNLMKAFDVHLNRFLQRQRLKKILTLFDVH
jgi:hypothetical protein